MTDIEILRGYELLSDNTVQFGIRVANHSDTVITDVEIILDYPESLFKLQGDRIQKLGNIPSTISRTAKFVLKPTSCVHRERIEADVKYRNSKNEKHMLSMRPKEIDCVCPFLRAKPLTKSEFLELASTGHVVDTGINFQGVSKDQMISFLKQTCTSQFHKVDEYSIDGNNVFYFSSESVGEKTYYLLTVLIKEQDGLTQIMLRAVSDQNHGIHGFLNEIVSELKYMVQTVNSSREIGIIKHEQVINIIDSVVQRTSFSMKDGLGSINIKDSVVQRSEIETSPSSVNITDSVVQHTSINANDEKKKEDEIKLLEAASQNAAEKAEKKWKEEDRRLRSQAEMKKLEEERLRKEHEKQELRSGKKKISRLFIPVMFIIVLVGYWMFSPLFEEQYTLLRKLDSQGSGNGQFNIPSDVAVDSSGNVYVSDSGNNRIQKFDSHGNFITKWGSKGSGDGQFNKSLYINVDSSGNVYVCDSGNYCIQKFDSNGNFITKWSFMGSDGQIVNMQAFAIDSLGNFYLTDISNDRIQKFDSSGNFITNWGSEGSGNGEFNRPCGIAVDSSGNVYVTDISNDCIQKFDSNGNFIKKWGSEGSGNGEFSIPTDIAVDSSGNVYTIDCNLFGSIQKFDSKGNFITQIDEEFSSPFGIAVDSSENIYIADQRKGVLKFSIKN